MSWSVQAIGTRVAVAAACEAQFAKQAAGYAGKEEAKDITAAQERVAAALAVPFAGANGVEVKANGSRSDGYLTMNVLVMPTNICLDAPNVPSPPPTTPAT